MIVELLVRSVVLASKQTTRVYLEWDIEAICSCSDTRERPVPVQEPFHNQCCTSSPYKFGTCRNSKFDRVYVIVIALHYSPETKHGDPVRPKHRTEPRRGAYLHSPPLVLSWYDFRLGRSRNSMYYPAPHSPSHGWVPLCARFAVKAVEHAQVRLPFYSAVRMRDWLFWWIIDILEFTREDTTAPVETDQVRSLTPPLPYHC